MKRKDKRLKAQLRNARRGAVSAEKTHALFSPEKIDKLISLYNNNKVDFVLFKLYPLSEDPSKVVPGQFTGGVSGAKNQGEVINDVFAHISVETALALYGKTGRAILEKSKSFNDKERIVEELMDLGDLLPPKTVLGRSAQLLIK